MVTEDDLIYDA